MAWGELAQRVTVAAVGIPLVVAAVYAGGWVLGALLAAAAALAAMEFYRLADVRGERTFAWAGAAVAATAVLVGVLSPDAVETGARLWTLLVVFVLYLAAAAIWLRGVEGRPLTAMAVTVAGAVYTGGTLVYGVFLRRLLDGVGGLGVSEALAGSALFFFPVALTWLNDTFAYFGGRAWGRRKLIPSVSPGKTVAGAVTALAGTVVVGALYSAFVLGAWVGLPVDLRAGAVAGVLVSLAAQVGDLAESLLKREAGVKDSGHLIPGHGGVLDRLDALFFTVPVMYWYLTVVLAAALREAGL